MHAEQILSLKTAIDIMRSNGLPQWHLVGSSFLRQIFCQIFYKLNFEVSHGKLISKVMLDSTRLAQVSRECQTFANYPTILCEPSTDFFGLIILGREKTFSRWPISNGAERKHRYRDTKTRPYSGRDVNKNPLPVGIELESGALSIKYELTNLTTKSWGKKEYCVIRSNAHDFMSIWGFSFFSGQYS